MSSIAHPRAFSAFSALLWTAFLVAVFYLFAWPALQGLIVVKSWKQIPAYVPKDNVHQEFFFSDNGIHYYSPRLNLWLVQAMDPRTAPSDGTDQQPNTTCYVKENAAGQVTMAVLDPRLVPGFDFFLDRIAIAGLLLVTALVLEINTRRARRKSRPAATAPGEAP